MRFFNNKINILSFLFLSLFLVGCDSDDTSESKTPLNALFISSTDSRTVTFTNLSSGASSYSWDFGNSETSNFTSPSVTFVDNGSFTVVLTAFDEDGNADTFEETFVIDIPICQDETAENIDPGNGNLNWTFLNANGDASFDAFGNIGGAIVTNPVLDNTNSSCAVYQYNKLTGCETWSGTGVSFTNAIDFSNASTGKVFTMKVLAENQLTDVTLRLEFMPFPNTEPSQERVASITQLGEWQELTFDFSGVAAGTFQSMIIYFERNVACDGDIYYFDDIIQQ